MAIRDTSGLNEDGKEQDRSVLNASRKISAKEENLHAIKYYT